MSAALINGEKTKHLAYEICHNMQLQLNTKQYCGGNELGMSLLETNKLVLRNRNTNVNPNPNFILTLIISFTMNVSLP